MKSSSAAVLCVAALLIFVPLAASAQDQPDAPAPGTDTVQVNPFLRGEQTLQLNVGFHLPAFLLPVTDQGVSNLDIGGQFTFGYQYFLSPGFAVGGALAGAFNSTIGELTVFVAPVGATAGYWWSRMPFEFCVLGELGGYIMRYNKQGMLGPFAKAGGGVLYRVTSSWSLGLQSFFWFVPEFHYGDYSDLTQYSGFVEVSVAAVYHL